MAEFRRGYIGRAARACVNSGQAVDNHFTGFSKMVEVGLNTVREVKDWYNSRKFAAGKEY